jgi:hypothetical protein
VIDKDDVLAAAPPLYLPMHQQDVIHAFLDRVRVIGDDVHECILCLERYHSMMLHDTLCARCHNEVCPPFSLVRALTDILMPTVHRTANIATTPQIMSTLARSRQNSMTSSTASLRWGCSAASPRLASSYGKQKWAMLSLPLPWAPDGLAYIDDTDSGSRTLLSSTRFPNN